MSSVSALGQVFRLRLICSFIRAPRTAAFQNLAAPCCRRANLRAERPAEPSSATVMRLFECQNSMTHAAGKIGMKRITHHDLRHLFATICIESGVDIPTVSRWLGHKDGGALCMKTYGHLRQDHSLAQAQRVNFGVTA